MGTLLASAGVTAKAADVAHGLPSRPWMAASLMLPVPRRLWSMYACHDLARGDGDKGGNQTQGVAGKIGVSPTRHPRTDPNRSRRRQTLGGRLRCPNCKSPGEGEGGPGTQMREASGTQESLFF